MKFLLIYLIIGSISAFLMGFLVYGVLKRLGVVDKPSERSSHQTPTVRGGGIIVLAPFLGSLGYVGLRSTDIVALALALALTSIALVALLDDLYSVSQIARFMSHVLGALVLIGVLMKEDFFILSAWGATINGTVWVLLFLWLVGYANAFNFMDGVNGLATVQVIITTSLVSGILASIGALESDALLVCVSILVGALGFLPHNFPSARMFLGDIGSMSLGFGLAGLAVWVASQYGWWLMVPISLIHANFVLDPLLTMFRRMFVVPGWWRPHREHFYQRLLRSGVNHSVVTGSQGGIQVVFLFLILGSAFSSTLIRVLILTAVIAVWLSYFGICEWRFRRTQRVVSK